MLKIRQRKIRPGKIQAKIQAAPGKQPGFSIEKLRPRRPELNFFMITKDVMVLPDMYHRYW